MHLGTAVHPGVPRIVQMEPGQPAHAKRAQIIVYRDFRIAEIRRCIANLLCLEMSQTNLCFCQSLDIIFGAFEIFRLI